jgi:hypothetical protein
LLRSRDEQVAGRRCDVECATRNDLGGTLLGRDDSRVVVLAEAAQSDVPEPEAEHEKQRSDDE